MAIFSVWHPTNKLRNSNFPAKLNQTSVDLFRPFHPDSVQWCVIHHSYKSKSNPNPVRLLKSKSESNPEANFPSNPNLESWTDSTSLDSGFDFHSRHKFWLQFRFRLRLQLVKKGVDSSLDPGSEPPIFRVATVYNPKWQSQNSETAVVPAHTCHSVGTARTAVCSG